MMMDDLIILIRSRSRKTSFLFATNTFTLSSLYSDSISNHTEGVEKLKNNIFKIKRGKNIEGGLIIERREKCPHDLLGSVLWQQYGI